MKRLLLAIIMVVLVLPATRMDAGVDVSIDFFYDNIGSDGSWVEVADYGYCWQPRVVVSNSRWRPYSDGYWAYTDVGWTWISYEDFGWATYHYGRWIRLRDHGWFWVPGREWGPAWVSWRTGGDYIGWAPLPPRGGGEVVYESRAISGQVDLEFDIGPDYYNFIDVRYIGEPILRERIVEPHLNVTYITQTVNVTNISYADTVVYNYGPDYDTLSRYSARPIRRMTVEHDANADLSVAAKSKSLTRVEADKLVVAAPPTLQKPPKPIAPKMVKEKIVNPAVEHGWTGLPDPKAQAEMRAKMKKEDPKNVPPPSIKPRENAETPQSPASASPEPSAPGARPETIASPAKLANPPAATAPPATSTSPGLPPDKERGKDRRLEGASPLPTAAASIRPAPPSPGKFKRERDEKPGPSVGPSLTTPGSSPAPMPNQPNHRRQEPPSSLATSPDGTPFREPPVRDKDTRKAKHIERAPEVMPPTRQPAEPLTEKAPRRPKYEPPVLPPNREAPPDNQPKRTIPPERVMPSNREAPPEAPRKHPVPPEHVMPPPPVPGGNAPAEPEVPRNKRGPDKKAEPAASPGP